jgi:hypothetical protein
MLYIKIFGIVDKRSGLLVDAWAADSIEEAQRDNPDAKIIDFTNFEKISFLFNEIWKVPK